MQIIVQMENNSGTLLYIDSAYISSKENNFFVTYPLFVTSLLSYFSLLYHHNTHRSCWFWQKFYNTYITKLFLQETRRAWEPSFLLKKLCYICVIKFVPEPATSMCVPLLLIVFFGPRIPLAFKSFYGNIFVFKFADKMKTSYSHTTFPAIAKTREYIHATRVNIRG